MNIAIYTAKKFDMNGQEPLIIYTDGSYKKSNKNICGASAIIYNEHNQLQSIILLTINHPMVGKSHHIVGELLASQTVCSLFKSRKITLYHDYDGVYRLLLPKTNPKHYNPKSEIALVYCELMGDSEYVLKRVKFVNVRGHADSIENHIADYYANVARYQLGKQEEK